MRSVIALAVLLGTASASAAEKAQCTATEIVATNEKKGVDPRLSAIAKKLATPQFRAWDTFKVVGEAHVAVEEKKPASSPIQYGKVTLLLKDKDVTGGRARLHMGVDLDDKNGRRQISMSASFDTNDYLIVTGPQFQGGLYILAIGCQTQ